MARKKRKSKIETSGNAQEKAQSIREAAHMVDTGNATPEDVAAMLAEMRDRITISLPGIEVKARGVVLRERVDGKPAPDKSIHAALDEIYEFFDALEAERQARGAKVIHGPRGRQNKREYKEELLRRHQEGESLEELAAEADLKKESLARDFRKIRADKKPAH